MTESQRCRSWLRQGVRGNGQVGIFNISRSISQSRVGNRKRGLIALKKRRRNSKKWMMMMSREKKKCAWRVFVCAHHQLALPIFSFFSWWWFNISSAVHLLCDKRPSWKERRWDGTPHIFIGVVLFLLPDKRRAKNNRKGARPRAAPAAAVPSYNIQRVYSSCFMASYYVADRIKRPTGNGARLAGCVCVCCGVTSTYPETF